MVSLAENLHFSENQIIQPEKVISQNIFSSLLMQSLSHEALVVVEYT